MSFLVWEAQNRTQYSGCSLTSAEYIYTYTPTSKQQQWDLQGLIKDTVIKGCAASIFTPFWLQPRGTPTQPYFRQAPRHTKIKHLSQGHTQPRGRGEEKWEASIIFLSLVGELKVDPVSSQQLAVGKKRKILAAFCSSEEQGWKSLRMFTEVLGNCLSTCI